MLVRLWRGLIRNGSPVCPKHIQLAYECMQMPFWGCFHVLIRFLQAVAHTQMQVCVNAGDTDKNGKRWCLRPEWGFSVTSSQYLLPPGPPASDFLLRAEPNAGIQNKSKLCPSHNPKSAFPPETLRSWMGEGLSLTPAYHRGVCEILWYRPVMSTFCVYTEVKAFQFRTISVVISTCSCITTILKYAVTLDWLI